MANSTLWRGVWAIAAIALIFIVRACGYDVGAVGRYFGYLTLYVVLPGTVVLYGVKRGPVSLTSLLALAVPTGFAVEIFTFLGLAATNAKSLYVWTPLLWAGAAVAIRLRRQTWPLRLRVSANHAGICVVLGIAFLATAVMAASQMFSEAPLAHGLPTRAIFHDWVYLVSRAAVIKNHWPLDDPSLSGTPLQYHYFMMVHAAAASWTTGVEISTVLLRLIFVPLGAVLVTQAYALGRSLSRSPWGGVIAALLTVAVSETSFESSYGEPMFLGLFVRWLFVSPTFFFGLIFCNALLIAVARGAQLARCDARHYAWLILLGTAGTGAKGTMMPVLLCALALWTAWQWWHERKFPGRLVAFGVCLTAAFAIVYIPTMSAWRTGDAAWRPFHVFQLTGFWKEYLPRWQHGLATWLPVALATPLAKALCAAVVFAGTCGVRLLAIPYLFFGGFEKRDVPLAAWIGAFFIASAGMGVLMELNSYGELYLILMMRLPMAVLTSAFLVSAWRRIAMWWRTQPASRSNSPFGEPRRAGALIATPLMAGISRVCVVAGVAVLLFTLAAQTSLWWTRNRVGLAEWWKTPTDLKPDAYMRDLQEALLWVRNHTDRDSVLVANAFTPENMKKDYWGALDHTLMGVHFYYSAYSERRLWFEGPNYILDTTRARIRAGLASNFFYRGRPLSPLMVTGHAPCYVLIDHDLKDGANVALPQEQRVFSNSRMDVYRLSEPIGDGSQ